jgi:hypothetical protein
MTITRIWQSGWETNNVALESTGSTGTVVTAPHTGSYALRMGSTLPTYIVHGAALTQSRTACHFRYAGGSTDAEVISLRSTTTNIVRVQFNPSTLAWTVLCGATTVATAGDTGFTPADTYFHIGVDVKIHASAGWVTVYRDGIAVVSYTGKTDHGGSTHDRLHLGYISASLSSNSCMDNNYWDNTAGEFAPAAPPDLQFFPIRPNGDGTYSQWTGSDSDSTNNYLHVDDVTSDDDSTYTETSNTGQRDGYAMGTVTLADGWIPNAVVLMGVMRKLDAAGLTNAKLFSRVGSANLDGASQSLGTSYRLHTERQTTAPDGGAWNQAALDALEIGILSI